MGRKEHTSGNVWATLNGWLKGCVKRTSGCVVTVMRWLHIAWLIAPFATNYRSAYADNTYITPTSINIGQNYGDYVKYRVTRDGKVLHSTYYDTVTESNFVALLDIGQCFLYKWTLKPGIQNKAGSLFSTDNEIYADVDTEESSIVKIISASGLPIFNSVEGSGLSEILKLFPWDEIADGYVLGVVNKSRTIAYDITNRSNEYKYMGSYTKMEGKRYVLKDNSSIDKQPYLALDSRGEMAFYEDLVYGQKYIKQKELEARELEMALQSTNSNERYETVAFTNIYVYSYYTNKTIVINPQFYNLNSVLKMKYPKVATEGDELKYVFTRGGICNDPLVVHVITNGHWCLNIRWDANEDGTKIIKIKSPITDHFNDNEPFEILVKTLNRRTDVEL